MRADTTVVEADVAYPTDSGLLAKAVRSIAVTVKRVQAAGGATRTPVRDRSRSAGRRGPVDRGEPQRRSDESKAAVRRITGELADLAASAAAEADAVIRNARRALRRAAAGASGKLRRLVDDLETLCERSTRVVAQIRTRLSGQTPDGVTRLVSLHDPDARPIAKGRLGKPVEFGYKAQVTDNVDGVVLDHRVEVGNPPDAPQLAPAIKRIARRTGKVPKQLTAARASHGSGRVVGRRSRPRGLRLDAS